MYLWVRTNDVFLQPPRGFVPEYIKLIKKETQRQARHAHYTLSGTYILRPDLGTVRPGASRCWKLVPFDPINDLMISEDMTGLLVGILPSQTWTSYSVRNRKEDIWWAGRLTNLSP